MHVALLTTEYPPEPHGGIGAFTHDLAQGLKQSANLDVTVIVVREKSGNPPATSEPSDRGDVNVVEVRPQAPKWMRWRLGEWWKRILVRKAIAKLHRQHPVDILETADNLGWLPFGAPCGIPTVVRMHGATFYVDALLGMKTSDPLIHQFEKRGLRRADFLVSVSEYTASVCIELAGVARDKVQVIYNSVDTEEFAPPAEDISEEGLVVFVNSVHPRKGIIDLCRAFPSVVKRVPWARLDVVGRDIASGGQGIPLSKRLLAEMPADVRDRVRFLGPASRPQGVIHHLARASVCCFPSHLEAFAIAPLEAMSLGKPTVYTTTCSGPETMEHGVSGWLVNPSDPASISDGLCTLLLDQPLAKRLGEQARKRVVELFAYDRWIQTNAAFYRRCIAEYR